MNFGFGALGDSYYEYLLKAWLQGGKQEKRLKDQYDASIDGMMKLLFGTSKKDGYMFVESDEEHDW